MNRRKVNLLEGPILKNLIILAAPLMATAFVQMTYNFVDMAWLGQLGTNGVAAAGAGGIYNWLASALASIARVGTNVFAAQYFGAKEEKNMQDTIKSGLYLVIGFAALYFTLIQIFSPQLIGFYELEPKVHDMGVIYLRAVAIGYLFQFLNPVLSSIYNSIGDSVRPFKMNTIGLIINIALDPILIFGFGPIPAMGILGAALATVFAQFVVTILFLIDAFKSKNEVYDGIKYGVAKLESIVDIFKMGFPAGMQSALHASISLVLNKFVALYGSIPLAVYTIGTNIESISYVTTEGFQGGIIAFVGQNYGARKFHRLKEAIKKSLLVVGGIGLLATFILIFFRNDLFKLFLPDDPVAIQMGAGFLLILGLSQFFMSIEIGGSGVFHGLGLTKIPSTISIIFNLLRIPLALLLMQYFDFYGVWMAVTISSIFKGTISNYIIYRKYHNMG